MPLKFVVIYVVGSILLVIGGIQRGNALIWIFNLMIAIIALVTGYFAKKARPV